MSSQDQVGQNAKNTLLSYATAWGKSPLTPMLLATTVTALHARPFQPLPMVFPPILLFSSYLNLSNYVTESAGITASWSGLYLLLASRRKVAGANFSRRLGNKFGARGLTRGAAMAIASANVVGGGITYALGTSSKSNEEANP